MSTIEEKRLIATFMNYAGGKPLTDDLLLSLYNDWNSVMPVVVECFNRYDDVEDVSDNQQFLLNDALLETDINVLYKAVVKYIQWYNKQNN